MESPSKERRRGREKGEGAETEKGEGIRRRGRKERGQEGGRERRWRRRRERKRWWKKTFFYPYLFVVWGLAPAFKRMGMSLNHTVR